MQVASSRPGLTDARRYCQMPWNRNDTLKLLLSAVRRVIAELYVLVPQKVGLFYLEGFFEDFYTPGTEARLC